MKANYREVPAPGSRWRECNNVIVTVSAATYSRVEFHAEGQPTRMLPALLFHRRFELVEPAPESYVQPAPQTGYRHAMPTACSTTDHPIITRFNALRQRVQAKQPHHRGNAF